jgi:hypothetical protein
VEAAAEFLSAQSYLVIGAFNIINLNQKQKEAMQAIGEELNPEYYRGRLVHAIELLLKGFTAVSF